MFASFSRRRLRVLENEANRSSGYGGGRGGEEEGEKRTRWGEGGGGGEEGERGCGEFVCMISLSSVEKSQTRRASFPSAEVMVHGGFGRSLHTIGVVYGIASSTFVATNALEWKAERTGRPRRLKEDTSGTPEEEATPDKEATPNEVATPDEEATEVATPIRELQTIGGINASSPIVFPRPTFGTPVGRAEKVVHNVHRLEWRSDGSITRPGWSVGGHLLYGGHNLNDSSEFVRDEDKRGLVQNDG